MLVPEKPLRRLEGDIGASQSKGATMSPEPPVLTWAQWLEVAELHLEWDETNRPEWWTDEAEDWLQDVLRHAPAATPSRLAGILSQASRTERGLGRNTGHDDSVE